MNAQQAKLNENAFGDRWVTYNCVR